MSHKGMNCLNKAEAEKFKATNHKDAKFFSSILKAEIENLYELSYEDNIDVYKKINNKSTSTGSLKYNNNKSKVTLIFMNCALMLRHDEKSDSRFFINKNDLRLITKDASYNT
tara:strand:+ start:215 stop:553 length:339 start_codon:yes stop_codon:yes gene_type:complete